MLIFCVMHEKLYFREIKRYDIGDGGGSSVGGDSSCLHVKHSGPPGNARLDFDGSSQFHHPVMHKEEF